MKSIAFIMIAFGMFFIQTCPPIKEDPEENGSLIELQILEPSVVTKKDSLIVKMTSKFTNSNRINYLLYSVKSVHPSYRALENCRDSASLDFGSRIAYTVMNSKGEIMKSYYSIGSNRTRVTADSLQSVLVRSRSAWINDRIILNSSQPQNISHSFTLKGLELKKGKYFIYLFYREGGFVKEYLGKEQIMRDEIEGNAILFLGCIKSNIVPLIVE